MLATYGGSGAMPPEHLHPFQTERFEVLDGTVKTRIEGVERRYRKGEIFEVPPMTPHTMGGDGPATVRWQVRPALRTAEFFEQLYTGGAGDGFLEEFSQEFRLT
jgi:quercetin dioxygenase-like cupin family protein